MKKNKKMAKQNMKKSARPTAKPGKNIKVTVKKARKSAASTRSPKMASRPKLAAKTKATQSKKFTSKTVENSDTDATEETTVKLAKSANPAEAPGHRKVNIAESSYIPKNETLAQHNQDARQKFTRAARTRVNGASHRRVLNSRGK